MNIAEILKNTPKGTKLYSPIFGDVTFKGIDSLYIEVLDLSNIVREFYHDGRFYMNGECILFPSRENRDWSTFSIFKKGDFLVAFGSGVFIYNGITDNKTLGAICGIDCLGRLVIKYISPDRWCDKKGTRKATDEEIKSFYDKLKEEGYTWNAHNFTITKVIKFDINELKPFDKVLVRDTNYNNWRCGFFDSISGIHDFKFRTTSSINTQCIPYNDETKHLVGTTNDCPEYYKTW